MSYLPLSVLKNPHRLIMGEMLCCRVVLSILEGSSSFLQITRPTINAQMSLNFGMIPSLTLELAAHECQKN